MGVRIAAFLLVVADLGQGALLYWAAAERHVKTGSFDDATSSGIPETSQSSRHQRCLKRRLYKTLSNLIILCGTLIAQLIE